MRANPLLVCVKGRSSKKRRRVIVVEEEEEDDDDDDDNNGKERKLEKATEVSQRISLKVNPSAHFTMYTICSLASHLQASKASSGAVGGEGGGQDAQKVGRDTGSRCGHDDHHHHYHHPHHHPPLPFHNRSFRYNRGFAGWGTRTVALWLRSSSSSS
jgi:hypothetical protein